MVQRHEELIRSLERKAVFTYHASDECITLNGEHFIKGIPAKILRSILLAYTRQSKCEFEYREFKRDFEITLGQKNSNFEIRFNRLMEKLAEKDCSIRIEKVGRGRFILVVIGKVILEE